MSLLGVAVAGGRSPNPLTSRGPDFGGQTSRYTPEQKRALLDEAQLPGKSISLVAREYGVSPSVLFQWKRVMDDATNKSLQRNEKVVPESEAKKLKARIRELERMLGKKTMENEILQEALEVCREVARKKKLTSRGGSSQLEPLVGVVLSPNQFRRAQAA